MIALTFYIKQKLVLIAAGESIDMGVVEERLLAITPWETLGTNAHEVVGFELRAFFMGMLLVSQVGVEHTKTNCGECNEESHLLPQLEATSMASSSSSVGGRTSVRLQVLDGSLPQ